MSIFTNPEDLIKQRFEALFLDLKAAQQPALQKSEPVLNVIEIEQSKTARTLLRVEKQAIREKDLNIKSNLSFLNTITDQINIEVEIRLKESIADTEQLYSKIIGIDRSLPELLDLVGLKAATITKVEPLATELPWFFNDLMKFVNQPKYRRIDNKGKAVIIETMRVGLNFFGLENLMIIITSLAFKRSLPQITDPYPQIKLRIWEEALTTAISCKQIASVVGVNQDHAFCLGMLQMMGKVVVSKLYFRLFESVLREALLETQNTQKHEEHSALTRVSPSGKFLNQLIDKYALEISAKLIDKMAMQRVIIANAMFEVANNEPAANLSPLALVLKQGKAYGQYRMLKGHKLVDLQQSKDFIRTLGMPKGSLELLKTTDMRSLDLSMNND
ncbi:HDOD domain-containing protein [Paraglaciecola sp. MB-3u-78]|uniref:HDOD domain-containing protein n=1 Tax=Paraglaciecola sp. MB-3u-78 TaxID=2058332 RepID=UPI000C31BA60|nr:HDOD domain-containing protein [Paraglaciecola sp. MB-3u-78]PKG99933.1 HDOD domain-containing protein [Paraglaciecola sp. MB-3u-78]